VLRQFAPSLLSDTEHAGNDTTSVGEPDEGGGQDEASSIDDGVLSS
jgi:hypothetical protein